MLHPAQTSLRSLRKRSAEIQPPLGARSCSVLLPAPGRALPPCANWSTAMRAIIVTCTGPFVAPTPLAPVASVVVEEPSHLPLRYCRAFVLQRLSLAAAIDKCRVPQNPNSLCPAETEAAVEFSALRSDCSDKCHKAFVRRRRRRRCQTLHFMTSSNHPFASGC